MKLILLIALFVGIANAESQCTARRVPSNKCAVLYLNENCGDDGNEQGEGRGIRVSPRRYKKSKNVVVRPGCKFVGSLRTNEVVTIDASVSNSHLWERLSEDIERFDCQCTGTYPGGRPPASAGIGGEGGFSGNRPPSRPDYD